MARFGGLFHGANGITAKDAVLPCIVDRHPIRQAAA